MYYLIRIKGHLDTAWQSRFDDLSIQHEETGTTLLSGDIPDQPALYGIVLKLSQIGVTLLSVEADKLHITAKDRVSQSFATQPNEERKEQP
jgi:hypothetical protein